MARDTRRSRETWVDAVKVLACVLIVLGHFFQSMVKGNILDSTATYIWFNRTIYYFHVPLLFLCCGYLYQQGKPVKTVDDWKRNVLKTLVTLGVPFLLFSSLNWLVKTTVTGSVNAQAVDLLKELFVQPAAPYWYLYTLLFVFLLTPTFTKPISAFVIVGLALGAKGVSLLFGGVGIYAADTLCSYWLWFAVGMLLSYVKAPKTLRKQKGAQLVGIALLVLFFVGSFAVIARNVSSGIVGFIFGICGCSAVVVVAITAKFTDTSRKVVRWMSDYTMPVYLMHTIFTAGMKSVLLKFGVTNAAIYIVSGLVISFAGPILVGFILKKLKWAEFILYPGKFIKFGSGNEEVSHSKKA